MSFPLTPVPVSIGTNDGMLLKTIKVKGMRYLLKSQLSPEKHNKNFILVIEDGNTLFYSLKDMPSLNICQMKSPFISAFHLHSTDGKNTNSHKLLELKSSQEEINTRVILYWIYAKQKD